MAAASTGTAAKITSIGDSLVGLDRLNHRVFARDERLDLSPTATGRA